MTAMAQISSPRWKTFGAACAGLRAGAEARGRGRGERVRGKLGRPDDGPAGKAARVQHGDGHAGPSGGGRDAHRPREAVLGTATGSWWTKLEV